MDERSRRIGQNEALFREVNERVAELSNRFQTDPSIDIVCECGDETCFEQLALTHGAYEALRAEATHFAVVPGHELPEVEVVVSRHEGYDVVRKLPGGAAELAEATDPRDAG